MRADFDSVFVLLVLIVLFFVFRAALLWYWRINDIVTKLDDILKELKTIATQKQA